MTEKEIREAIKDLEEIKRALATTKFKNKVCSINKAIYALEQMIESNRK